MGDKSHFIDDWDDEVHEQLPSTEQPPEENDSEEESEEGEEE